MQKLEAELLGRFDVEARALEVAVLGTAPGPPTLKLRARALLGGQWCF